MFKVLIASGKMKAPRPVGGAVASMIAHGAIVTVLLLGSRPAMRAATEFEERIAEYLFPKDRAPGTASEEISYLRLPGGGAGPAAHPQEAKKAHDPRHLSVQNPRGGTAGTPDPVAAEQKMAESMGAFALLDVDSGAVRDPRSAAPAYPEDMMAKGIEGVVRVRFVIDSTGLIDLSTVKVLEKTNDAFALAVRAAMPGMRFRPAMMGAQAVRQLSEQSFAFRVVVKSDAVADRKP